MKTTNDNFGGDERVPGDVAEIAALLDALGELDRRSMDAAATGRIAGASGAALRQSVGSGLASQEVAVTIAARDDMDSAPAGLEDRVFEASRGELVGAGRGLRLVGEGKLPPRSVARPVWWRSAAMKVAAAVAIVGTGVATLVMMKGMETKTTEPNVAIVKASFDSELETFFDLLESTPESTSVDVGTGTDHSITDTLLDWESL